MIEWDEASIRPGSSEESTMNSQQPEQQQQQNIEQPTTGQPTCSKKPINKQTHQPQSSKSLVRLYFGLTFRVQSPSLKVFGTLWLGKQRMTQQKQNKHTLRQTNLEVENQHFQHVIFSSMWLVYHSDSPSGCLEFNVQYVHPGFVNVHRAGGPQSLASLVGQEAI